MKESKRKCLVMSEVLYVDACCCHQADKFSWGIVGENISKGGSIERQGINSGYSELYATYQALLCTKDNVQTTIFTDNAFVVNILNSSREKFEWKMSHKNYHINKDFIRNVYNVYQKLDNVLVMKIHRSDNIVADKLARSFKDW